METTSFISKLSKASTRFLSEAVEHSLACGRRTPADFIRHFPPGAIMSALETEPRIRAVFLTVLVGLRDKTALRTPSEDAGRLLQAALEEGDTDADGIARTFEPDHRVRFLDDSTLWAFVTEGEFWKVSRSKDAAAHKIAQAHLAYLIDRGLAHGLLSHTDLIEGISIELIAEKLPRAELAKVIRKALDIGHTGAPFKHVDLFDASPSSVLVDHIALPHIFESVILPVARAAGLVEASAGSAPWTRVEGTKVEGAKVEVKGKPEADGKKADAKVKADVEPAPFVDSAAPAAPGDDEPPTIPPGARVDAATGAAPPGETSLS